MRIAIYARVSKNNDTQTPDNQLIPLRDFAKALQGEVIEEYIDLASGAGVADRVRFLQMLDDADRRKFDLILISGLDRFSREGIGNTLAYLERLKRNGIALKSLQEPWLDTRDEGIAQLLLAIFSWVALQERKRMTERINMGLDRARANGIKLGRPLGKKDGKKRRAYLRRHNTRRYNLGV